MARNVFEGLVYNSEEDLSPQPGMATHWELSEDGLVYTFHLREATWSDGAPVTAHDFEFSWKRTLDPLVASKYANMLYPLEGAEAYNSGETTDPGTVGVRALDDRTLEVRMHSPCGYFLDLCCFYTLLPTPQHVVEKYGENWIKPEYIATNGPFELEEWLLNRRIRLRKFEGYWNAENVALDVVDCVPSDNINANFNLYMSGVADWGDASSVPNYVIPELMKRGDFHVSPYLATYFYRFNVNRPPWTMCGCARRFFLPQTGRTSCST